jgi:hypothetical protein
MRNVYNILVGKPGEKTPHGRPRSRWEDNIRIDIRETGCGLDSSGSEWGPVTGSCEHDNEPLGSIKGKEFLD